MHDVGHSEKIEQQALRGWFDAASALESSTFDWTCVEIGDALCYVSSSEPSILVNRVLGLGSQTTPTIEQLDAIRNLYRDAGVSRFFLHVIPDRLGPARSQLLTEAGYEQYRGWMKFRRGVSTVSSTACELKIRRVGRDDAAAFASIVGGAFDFSTNFQPAIAALADDDNWHVYMSFSGETPAGTGALYLRDGLGYLDFGATHPDYRRRGSQTALLNARIRDAFEARCTAVITMTGEAVPGDAQHSYSNIKKAGFAEAFLRENWIPANT